jgi:DNA-binding PadR family transcriptional regulator
MFQMSVGPVDALPVWVRPAVLGLVIERPGYGRDIEDRFERRLPAWAMPPSAVYAALDELEQDGLIRMTSATAHTRRGARRSVYEATPLGVHRFERWMHAASAEGLVQDEAQLKVALSQAQDADRLIEMTYEQEAELLERLREEGLASATLSELLETHEVWDAVSAFIVREAENAHIQATLEWLGRARDLLIWAKTQSGAGEE